MKKHILIFIIISFLSSSNGLFALELSIPQCVTNTLMLLESTNRSVEEKDFPLLKVVNFCLVEQRLLQNCFSAPQWSKKACYAVVKNRIEKIPTIPLLPAVEALMGIAHYLLPSLPGPLFNKNVMIGSGRYVFYDFYKNLFKNNFCTLIKNRQCKQAVFLDMCMVGAGALMTSLAQYNNPELFLTYTYLNFSFFTQYSINQWLLLNIDTVFSIKRNMFLIAMILACCRLKSKDNRIFTDPKYWISIGMICMFFEKQGFSAKLYNNTCTMLHIQPHTTQHLPIRNKLAQLVCYNAIPIVAVLIDNWM